MQIGRLFHEEVIELELDAEPVAPPTPPEGEELSPEAILAARWRGKERVVAALAALFAQSGEIRNAKRFQLDLLHRERKASTALGRGLAVPHVRSLQPRHLVVCFARSTPGVEYLSPDGGPVHLFFGVVAPSWEESAYLRVYRWLAGAFHDDDTVREALMGARSAGEVVRILKSVPG